MRRKVSCLRRSPPLGNTRNNRTNEQKTLEYPGSPLSGARVSAATTEPSASGRATRSWSLCEGCRTARAHWLPLCACIVDQQRRQRRSCSAVGAADRLQANVIFSGAAFVRACTCICGPCGRGSAAAGRRRASVGDGDGDRARARTHVHTRAHSHTNTRTRTRASSHARTRNTYHYACWYIYVRMYIYICTYTYIYINTLT